MGLYGGFAGCGAADPNAQDGALYESVLSGDLLDDDVLYANELDCVNAGGVWYGVLCDEIGNNGENAYHVVVSTNNDATAILDGFTVSGGHADGPTFGPSPASQEQGSGINIYFGNPSIANCLVENNRADNHGAVNDHGGATLVNCELRRNFSTRWGGGLHNHASITTSLTDCRFIDNATAGTAGGGAGMFVKGKPTLTGCIFSGNVSATNGGAIYNDGTHVTLTLIDCTLSENSAVLGGAIYNIDGSRPVLTSCSITGNTAAEFGGGMYSNNQCHGVLTDCTFRANTAQTGGAIYIKFFCNPWLEGCTIIDNQAIGPDVGAGFVGGGGIWMQSGTIPYISRTDFINNTAITGGGAIYSSFTTSIAGGGGQFERCRFIGNTADYGGVAATYRDNIWFRNCEFSGNFAHGTSPRLGGGVLNNTQDSGVTNLVGSTFIHCTLTGNTSDGEGGAIMLRNGWPILTITGSIVWGNARFGGIMDERAQLAGSVGPDNLTTHYTLIQDWTGRFGGVGNFGADPLFVNASGDDNIAGTADDNLRLRAGSPCIGAGDSSANSNATSTDLDDNPRIVDGTIDLGAYEFRATCGDGNCEVGEGRCDCPEDCGDPASNEVPATSCSDGEDNDCDGLADCADPDCASATECPTCGDESCSAAETSCNCPADCGDPPSGETPGVNCSDGEDNDCDGLTDIADPDCVVCGDGSCDMDESRCNCPADCGDAPSSEVPGSSCADGEDNDCDTLTDCADPDCATAIECAVCGDGSCHVAESPCSCPADCGDPPSREDPASSCADRVDNDCDSMTDCADPDCTTGCPIPTVSAWGVCCMMLLLVTAGSLVLRGRESVCSLSIH